MITSFGDLLVAFGRILSLIIPLLAGIALLYFFWGLVQFIQKSGDEKGVAEGKAKMTWGIVVLFIIVSIWGIVGFIQGNIFGMRTTTTIETIPDPDGHYDMYGDLCDAYDFGTLQCSYDEDGNPTSSTINVQTEIPDQGPSVIPVNSRSL